MSGSVKLDDWQPSPAVDAEAVRVELDRILASQNFAGSLRLQEFLRYVVDETLAGRAALIKGLTIAQDVFQRDILEDPQGSAIVRVEAGRLRRRLADYYQREGQRGPVHIQIPKGTYVPSFAPASTEIEDGKPGLPGELPQDRRLRFKTTGLRTTAVRISLLMLAVATLLWGLPISLEEPRDRSRRRADTSVVDEFSKPVIAIFPFENSVSEIEKLSLAEGLTEDIVTSLSKLSGIDVIAMTSVQTYKDKDVIQQRIGRELRASHVLRGSVRGTRQKLRVTAQLFETRTGILVWVQRFDRQLEDELVLQIELAERVAESISARFREGERERLRGSSCELSTGCPLGPDQGS